MLLHAIPLASTHFCWNYIRMTSDCQWYTLLPSWRQGEKIWTLDADPGSGEADHFCLFQRLVQLSLALTDYLWVKVVFRSMGETGIPFAGNFA